MKEEYRYIFAQNIVATGKEEDPIIHCVDAVMNAADTSNFSSLHDLKIDGVVYAQDVVIGLDYNPLKKLKLLLKEI